MKKESYYTGALDALRKVDEYLEKERATAKSPIRKLWISDISEAVYCIGVDFTVESAKRHESTDSRDPQ